MKVQSIQFNLNVFREVSVNIEPRVRFAYNLKFYGIISMN